MSTTVATTHHPMAIVSRLLAVFLVMHGVAHFVGVTGTITHIRDGTSASVAADTWSVGNGVVLGVLAALWAVAGLAFMVVAVMLWLHAAAARVALLWVAGCSLALSAVSLWAAVVGVVINVVLMVAVWFLPALTGDGGGGR